MKTKKDLFRILSLKEWKKLKKEEKLFIRNLDIGFNYIHLCTKEQLEETINVHFKKISKLVILKLSCKKLKNFLKWEKSRCNQMFPHYYNDLSFSSIIDIKFLNRRNGKLYEVRHNESI